MALEKGDRFHVMEAVEVKDTKGRVKTRFLPGFGYTVTEGNLETVLAAEKAGKGRRGNPPNAEVKIRADARDAAPVVKGKVTTKGGNK